MPHVASSVATDVYKLKKTFFSASSHTQSSCKASNLWHSKKYTNITFCRNDVSCIWTALYYVNNRTCLPCTTRDASNTLKNLVKMVVVHSISCFQKNMASIIFHRWLAQKTNNRNNNTTLQLLSKSSICKQNGAKQYCTDNCRT